MITVHHLSCSRSQRILWLLEELGLDYDIAYYQRDAQLMAPPEMKALHPLGKSPMIGDKGHILIESGAIIDYILRHYAEGKLQPDPDSADYDRMVEWLHYAEGSATLPLMLSIYGGYHGVETPAFVQAAEQELGLHLRYIDGALRGHAFIVGDDFSAADVQMSFVAETAAGFADLQAYPAIADWLARLQNRPAYLRAIERGGEYVINVKPAA